MARNTDSIIIAAMKRLMQRKKLDDITVQELADEANVNKKTIYYHYSCIEDLLAHIFSDDLYKFIDRFGVNTNNWMELVKTCMRMMRADRNYFIAIHRSSYFPVFKQSFMKVFDHGMKTYVQTRMDSFEQENHIKLNLSPEKVDYIVSYHSMALAGMVEQWFAHGLKETEDEFAELINCLANDSMTQAFLLLQKKS